MNHTNRRIPCDCARPPCRITPIATRLLTVGHGTLAAEDFTALLHGAAVAELVDVRTAPGSKRHPHFRRQAMEDWVPAASIDYRWEPRLGGLRKPRPDSPNVALRHPGFRAYADHMADPEFAPALDEVLAGAARHATAVMCAESLWWKCHRRLIADFAVLVRGVDVEHLLHDGRLSDHRITEGARREGDLVIYDVGVNQSFGALGS